MSSKPAVFLYRIEFWQNESCPQNENPEGLFWQLLLFVDVAESRGCSTTTVYAHSDRSQNNNNYITFCDGEKLASCVTNRIRIALKFASLSGILCLQWTMKVQKLCVSENFPRVFHQDRTQAQRHTRRAESVPVLSVKLTLKLRYTRPKQIIRALQSFRAT